MSTLSKLVLFFAVIGGLRSLYLAVIGTINQTKFRQWGLNGELIHTQATRSNLMYGLTFLCIIFVIASIIDKTPNITRLLTAIVTSTIIWRLGRDWRVAEEKAVDRLSLNRTIERSPFIQAVWKSLPILIIDQKTSLVRYASPVAERLFGYALGELPGAVVDSVLPKVKEVFQGQKITIAIDGIRRDGTRISTEVLLSGTIVDSVDCILVTVVDFTFLQRIHDDSSRTA